ncbi:MAG: hypothetical protein A2682_02280 [Candidatus Terrybacteria bacterium RIFCSPHIGHO2_01_FULL_58_15]|uniref:Uncharacterized protein n=1 Tax=Terrybacteria sp. (strain RIFCSPHIGHO2_01_FULL_58_15) TaxID=1802363 RepID=A0A1G2PP19_TERXR|nr:MAG: hypothetical protein A2682_02280 [Candidatus Terrybacteria bacterium RIFCSPHIGHO2_01_FULL_58_15]
MKKLLSINPSVILSVGIAIIFIANILDTDSFYFLGRFGGNLFAWTFWSAIAATLWHWPIRKRKGSWFYAFSVSLFILSLSSILDASLKLWMYSLIQNAQ